MDIKCALFIPVLFIVVAGAKAFDISAALSALDQDIEADGSQCRDPHDLKYGSTLTLEQNTRAEYMCDTGYKRAGPSKVGCQNGRWPKLTRCLAKSCSIDEVLHSSVDNHRLTKPKHLGSVLTFQCEDGYVLQGNDMIYCFGDKDDPKWIGKPGHCVLESSLPSAAAIISRDKAVPGAAKPEGGDWGEDNPKPPANQGGGKWGEEDKQDMVMDKQHGFIKGISPDEEAGEAEDTGAAGGPSVPDDNEEVSDNGETYTVAPSNGTLTGAVPEKKWSSFLVTLLAMFITVCIIAFMVGMIYLIRRYGSPDRYNAID